MVNTVNGTAQTPSSGRLVRRRARPALDDAWETALSELPPEVRPLLRAWVEARRAEFDARSALSSEMTGHGLRWREVDKVARELAFG